MITYSWKFIIMKIKSKFYLIHLCISSSLFKRKLRLFFGSFSKLNTFKCVIAVSPIYQPLIARRRHLFDYSQVTHRYALIWNRISTSARKCSSSVNRFRTCRKTWRILKILIFVFPHVIQLSKQESSLIRITWLFPSFTLTSKYTDSISKKNTSISEISSWVQFDRVFHQKFSKFREFLVPKSHRKR